MALGPRGPDADGVVRGKLIVITGVSRGLGRALVGEMIHRGRLVAGCARSREAIEGLRRLYGAPHSFEVADVSRPEEVRDWASRVLAELGPPDLLCNNAALMNAPAPLWQVPEAEFARLVEANVTGLFLVTRAFLPAMIARGSGVVVNWSSGWGRTVSGQVAPYCASKWAVEGLTRALAEELPRGLAAVPLNPGVIDTDMLRVCWGESAGAYPSAEEWAARAASFLLGLGPKDNGRPLTVPGGRAA